VARTHNVRKSFRSFLTPFFAAVPSRRPQALLPVEFANVCDVNESTIRRILQGKQNISIKVLKRICEALDIKMSDLLKEVGN